MPYQLSGAYPLKWHYLARFGTLSKGLCLRKPYQAMSYDKSINLQVHSVKSTRSEPGPEVGRAFLPDDFPVGLESTTYTKDSGI